ncbi:alpha/beta hydrolase [Tenuibacillus multivorans]|uniref:Acetyl esterase n=1 Tax=Tenuibacillus multivorans TaxID=237069 RepID=A0A1G9YP55_9BACI|nr:alpha/beta hydrolase [Tenuibacillus multivorans]GEL78842.1 lipase/esterase [Tenuibacillus multivorans]SDN10989.1 acetyl esterase [Tenuibacillus multivorans]
MANLNEQSKIYLEMFKEMPNFSKMEPEEVRSLFNEVPLGDNEPEEVAQIEERTIPASDGYDIPIRVYTPEGQGPFPVLIYYHGGGWVLGDLDLVDSCCRMLANETKRVVVSVDYRLAPEHKYPIPLEDCYNALEWVYANPIEIDGDATNVVVGGDSAGGNLAAAVSMMAKDSEGPPITAQVLIYPVTNLSYDTSSYEEFAEGYGLDRSMMEWFGELYIRDEDDLYNPYVAPLTCEDLSGLPPAMVIVAENDVLRDEGLAYARRLKEAGVKMDAKLELGVVHGFFANIIFFEDQARQTARKINTFLSGLTEKVSGK